MKKRTKQDLTGKVIDIHSHIGVQLKSVYCQEYPFAESAESLYYKQRSEGIDVSVCFPFGPEQFCDLKHYVKTGKFIKDRDPLSPVPFQQENLLLLREVYEFCPELTDRFLPFVGVDPGRKFSEQLSNLQKLYDEFPIYGIKIVPVLCQSKVTGLLDFPDLFAFALEKDLPFLFHTTAWREEGYSYAGDIFDIIEKFSANRYCLAHCIGCHKKFLERANGAENVWFDTSAMKIQVQLADEGSPIMASEQERVEADYSDYREVMRVLAESFPETMIWGTDSPAYSYILNRKNADGTNVNFRLKSTYTEEVAALNYLSPELRLRVSSVNSLNFLFGLP